MDSTALRGALRRSRQVRLVGRGRARCFRVIEKSSKRATGRRLTGLVPFLSRFVFSAVDLPASHEAVRGPRGRARGALVDRQISSWADGRRLKKPHPLTAAVVEALGRLGLAPICGQLAVRRGRLATAADLVCASVAGDVVVIELKCGYVQQRETPVGRLRLFKAADCALHRHLAQLAVTTALAEADRGVAGALRSLGGTVRGLLVYASSEGVLSCLLEPCRTA